MKVLRFDSISQLNKYLKSTDEHYSVSIGNFDGCHIGHKAVLQRSRSLASSVQGEKCKTALLTFQPHPALFFGVDQVYGRSRMITSQKEKELFVKSEAIDEIWALDFNSSLVSLSALDFLDNITEPSVKFITTGEEFHFGKGRKGDAELLQKLSNLSRSWSYYPVPKVILNNKKVSSSRIRESLKAGAMSSVNKLLGRKYSISCKFSHAVAASNAICAEDIYYEESKIYPFNGVYLSRVATDHEEHNDRFQSFDEKDCYALSIIHRTESGSPKIYIHPFGISPLTSKDIKFNLQIKQLLKPMGSDSRDINKVSSNIFNLGRYVAEFSP